MKDEPQPIRHSLTENATMHVFDHLHELRQRLIYALIVFVVTTSSAYPFGETLFTWLCWPMRVLPHQKMIVLNPLEMFVVYIKIALLVGLLTSMPFWLWQLWLFVAPGLYPEERRYVVPFVLLGTLCFVGGAAFCFFLVLPTSFQYLTAMVPPMVEAHYAVSDYFSLVIQLMFAFGVVFELPLILALLAAAGIIDAAMLVRFRKYFFVVALIVAGILTPTPDPFTQILMAAPLWIFYEIGIVIAKRWSRSKAT
jgi:sec-independent protein translocase protein TatC